jgi:hypothetical protein
MQTINMRLNDCVFMISTQANQGHGGSIDL